MKILVLNCGSSSIKYALYNMDDKSVMTSGGAERVGLDGAFVKVKLANGEKKQIMHDIPEHTEGVKFIFSLLTDPEIGVIKSLDEIDAVGHRMVHGGEKKPGNNPLWPDALSPGHNRMRASAPWFKEIPSSQASVFWFCPKSHSFFISCCLCPFYPRLVVFLLVYSQKHCQSPM